MEEKNKQFPIFWTYIERNGEKTIHQVRFKALCVDGSYEIDADGSKYLYAYMSVFQIAGRNGIFISCPEESSDSASLKKYFDLSKVFPTKELAERYAKGDRSIRCHFRSISSHDCCYRITDQNPLIDCEWSWDKHIPSNMKVLKTKRDCNGRIFEHLVGYAWSGLETVLYNVGCKNKKIELANDIFVHNSLHDALFDMVSCNWLGEFNREYYKTKEECDNANKIKVYTFD